MKGLTKSFNNKQVVCNVDLQIKHGEIYGFLGPNGSGKTTTIRMICGLMRPDAGQGQCLGHDILTESAKIKTHVGYMTQKFSLYKDLSIRENLEFIARLYDINNQMEKVESALEHLGFSKQRQKQLAGNLSGGWQQRLALAGAMLHEPKVLLLDEPTAGVDPQARRDFWNEIHLLGEQGITSLVTTHYMDEAERCNRIAYLAYGHILSRGTTKEVIDQAGLTVWAICGNNLSKMAAELKKQPGVEQVTPFGNELHVVGHDPDALAKAIAPYQKKCESDPCECKKSRASLEDVFISLAAKAEDNFG